MGFFDDLADGLSGLIFDAKIEDGVRGTAQVVAASGYYGEGLYQNCKLEVVVEAPGIPATAATVQALVSRDTWPRAGQVLPALIERADPREVLILWDELPKSGDVATSGTTVKVVGDVSQITPEQRDKLKALGIDLDALLGGQPS